MIFYISEIFLLLPPAVLFLVSFQLADKTEADTVFLVPVDHTESDSLTIQVRPSSVPPFVFINMSISLPLPCYLLLNLI